MILRRGHPPSAQLLADLLADHARAVREFTARAAAVPPGLWDVPRAPGKWSPAQETAHLTLGYAAFVRDLRGGPALQLKGRWWQRRLWRWRALPEILASGRISRAAPAPREVRPPPTPGDQATLLAEFRARANEFDEAIRETGHEQPTRRVAHPYFDRLTLPELVRLCAVHTCHHAAFLPRRREEGAG